MNRQKYTSKDEALPQAIKTIFEPLACFLITQNITYINLQKLLKKIYVKVADESFKLSEKRQTDSRISLLTGIHRSEVKSIREEQTALTSDKRLNASLSAQIMSIWVGHQKNLDKNGKPKALFRYAQDGSPSFEELVHSISKDKHPRSFIDNWINQGVVEIEKKDGKEIIHLTEKGYIPEADYEEKLFFAGKNIGEHLSVIVHNLEKKSPSMLDRAVYYQQLTEESVEKLEVLSKNRMIEVLIEVNQRASELQEKDSGQEQATKGMHLGAYYYSN